MDISQLSAPLPYAAVSPKRQPSYPHRASQTQGHVGEAPPERDLRDGAARAGGQVVVGPAEPGPLDILPRRDSHVLPEVPLQRPRPRAGDGGKPGQRQISGRRALAPLAHPPHRRRPGGVRPAPREPVRVVVRLRQQEPGHQELRPRAGPRTRRGQTRGLVEVTEEELDHPRPGRHGRGGQVHLHPEPDRTRDRLAQQPLKVPLKRGALDPDMQLPVPVAQVHRRHHLRRDDPCPARRQHDLLVLGLDAIDALEREVDVVVRHPLGKLHLQLGTYVARVDEADGPEPYRRDVTEHLRPGASAQRRDAERCQQVRHTRPGRFQASGSEHLKPPQRPAHRAPLRLNDHAAIMAATAWHVKQASGMRLPAADRGTTIRSV